MNENVPKIVPGMYVYATDVHYYIYSGLGVKYHGGKDYYRQANGCHQTVDFLLETFKVNRIAVLPDLADQDKGPFGQDLTKLKTIWASKTVEVRVDGKVVTLPQYIIENILETGVINE